MKRLAVGTRSGQPCVPTPSVGTSRFFFIFVFIFDCVFWRSTMTFRSLVHVQTDRRGVVSRRSFGVHGRWGGEPRPLGMEGCSRLASRGPGQTRHGLHFAFYARRAQPIGNVRSYGVANGGPTAAIPTAVAGIRVAEGWTQTAKAMKDIALIRSLTNREGEHERATYQLHTGYIPQGSVKYPSLGSIVVLELGPQDFDLPHFVCVGNRAAAIGSGFLGMQFAPFVVNNPQGMPNNVALPSGSAKAAFAVVFGPARTG